jgi:hypothetical protein
MNVREARPIVSAIADVLKPKFAKLESENAALRVELAALKAKVSKLAKSRSVYRGIWREQEYQRGDEVTHAGDKWHCWRTTTQKPGTSGDWQLAEKGERRDRRRHNGGDSHGSDSNGAREART